MAEPRDDSSPSEHVIPFLPADWPQQTTARLVGFVDSARAKTTGPAIRVSRALVYGLVAVVLGLLAIPLLLIGLTRWLINSVDSGLLWVIPSVEHDKAVWIAYLALGAVFSAAGLVLWRRRPRGAAEPAPLA